MLSKAQTWEQKANFPGAGRHNAVSFSIGNKGYIGLGNNTSLVDFTDFWEWDQASNTWSPIAGFPGAARESAASFSIGKKGYVVCGYTTNHTTNELWEWDGDVNSPTYNVWTRKTDFPGTGRVEPVAFSMGKKGYIGTGSYTQDFWEWDGDTASASYNTWTQRANFGGGYRGWATGFTCGTKAYIGLGTDGSYFRKDFWEWDGDINSPTYNSWTQLPNFPGDSRTDAIGVSIGNKGYVGLGIDSTNLLNSQGFWEWDQTSHSWSQKINFAGTGRQSAEAFVIGNKVYVGVGYDNSSTNDFWEYCDTCSIVTNTKINTEKEIQFYPNPATDNIQLCNVSPGKTLVINLYGIAGQKIRTVKPIDRIMDVSDLEDGVYFFEVKTTERMFARKVIIKR